MKRVLTLILSLLMAFGVFSLVACGGEDTPDAPDVFDGYTITFNYGDGTGETATKKVSDNAAIGELPIPSAEPDHQIFEGWKLDNGTVVDATTLYTFGTDITLTAYYSQAYIITFNYGDGAGAVLNKKIKDNAAIGNLPVPSDVPSGKFFLNWQTEGGTVVDKTTVYNFGEDITLIAYYVEAFTVELDNTSASSITNWADETTGAKTMEVNVGDTITFPAIDWDGKTTQQKNDSDYRFIGWFYLDKNGVERELTAQTVFSLETLNIEGTTLRVYAQIARSWAGPY